MKKKSRIIFTLAIFLGSLALAPLGAMAHNYPHATCDAPPAAPSGYSLYKTVMLPHDQKLFNSNSNISGPFTATGNLSSGEYRVRLVSSEDSILPEQTTEKWNLVIKNSLGSVLGSWTTPDLPSNRTEDSWLIGTFNVSSGQSATTFISSFAGGMNNSVVAPCAVFYKRSEIITPPPTGQAPTVDIKVNGTDNPITVRDTETFRLTWISERADRCTASSSWTDSVGTSGNKIKGPYSAGNYSFYITCQNDYSTDVDHVAVEVITLPAQAPTVDIKANGSDSPSAIAYNTSATLTWTSENAVSCTASGDWSGSKSLNNTSGQSTASLTSQKNYIITCVNSAGVSDSDNVVVPVQNQQQTPTVILTANPTNVNQGNTSTLTWDSTNATSCYTSGGPWRESGTLPTVDGNQVSQALFNQTNTFSVTCTNAQGQSGSDQAVVTVNQNQDIYPSVDIKANGQDGSIQIAPNNQLIISWTSSNAISCESSGGPWSGTRSINGSHYPIVSNNFSATFSITCRSSSGHTANDSVTVYTIGDTINPPTVYINANPSIVSSGNSSTLTWGSSYANSCYASNGWSGSKGLSGTDTTGTLYGSQTYVITCTNSTGQSATAQTTVSVTNTVITQAPTLNLYADPSQVNQGQTSLLTWTTTNATYCSASGDWSGTKLVNNSEITPSLYTNKNYVMTCTGPGGNVTKSTPVVVSGVLGVTSPTLTIYAEPSPVQYGTGSTIRWSSTGTDVCYATSDWFGTKSVTGSMPTGPLYIDKTYTLTCSGQYGSITRSATVPVVGIPVVRGTSTYVPVEPVTYNYSAEISKDVRNVRTGERSNSLGINALPGDELEYAITIENSGTGNLSTLKITDKLTNKVRAISVSNGGVYDWQTNIVSWSIASLGAGKNKTLSFRVVVVSSACETEMFVENIAELYNTKVGTVRSNDGILNSTNPNISGGYPFLISVNNPNPIVEAGDEVRYTIDYRNNGNETVRDASLSVILPSGMKVKGHTKSASLKGNTVTLDIGSIRPRESGKVDVILEVRNDIMDGEQLVTIANLNYKTYSGNQESTTQTVSTVDTNGSNIDNTGASVGESGGTRFLPKTFFGWLLLLLLIIVIAVFIRRLFQE